MKKIFYVFIISVFSTVLFAVEKKPKCDTKISKLKPSCNFVGTGISKLKDFSSKNKTIDQSLRNTETLVEKGIDKIKKK